MSNQTDDDLYIGCKAYNGTDTSYGYVPSSAAGVAFCVLFGLSMLAHIVQFCWKRTWWCSVFALGSFGMIRSPTAINRQIRWTNRAQLNYLDGPLVSGARIAPIIPLPL